MDSPASINVTFTSKLFKVESKGGWTYAIWPETAVFFGTHGLVKVRGKIDGVAFDGVFMAMGDGTQMLPVNAKIRKQIGKEAGDSVAVQLTERLG